MAGTGQTVGTVGGATAGSFFGPVGTVAGGALGGLLGGLFDSSSGSGPDAAAAAQAAAGQAKLAAMKQGAQSLDNYRQTLPPAMLKGMQNQMGAYGPAQNVLQQMYGGHPGMPADTTRQMGIMGPPPTMSDHAGGRGLVMPQPIGQMGQMGPPPAMSDHAGGQGLIPMPAELGHLPSSADAPAMSDHAGGAGLVPMGAPYPAGQAIFGDDTIVSSAPPPPPPMGVFGGLGSPRPISQLPMPAELGFRPGARTF